MLPDKALRTLLFLLFCLDIGYTFLQQYHQPLDGDLAPIVVPSEHYETVLAHPFGWKVVAQDTAYAGPNRFFIYRAIHHYYRMVPLWLQKISGPVDGIYLAAALQKTATHFLLIWLLGLYIGGSGSLFSLQWLAPALLVLPLFQTAGYYFNLMGIVGQSPTYAFFYAFPLGLLLLFYYPAYRAIVWKEQLRLGWAGSLGILALAIVLPFGGPLVPGIVLVLSLMAVLRWGAKLISKRSWPGFLLQAPALYWLSLLALNVLSLYSLYIGSFNVEQEGALPLVERYARLPEGLFHQFTRKPGPALLLLMVAANALLLRWQVRSQRSRQVLIILRWIGLFSLAYILLLPLGGYREYRPLIIRRDTLSPVFLALFYFWGLSAYLLIRALSGKVKYGYWAFALLMLGIFTLADESDTDANACERAALEKLAASSSGVVVLDDSCFVLAWDYIRRPEQSALPCALLGIWGITEREQRFFQE